MAFLRGLDERFEQKHDTIYDGVRDMKDSAALHPIIIIAPNDPERRQGVGQSDRLVPIQRISTDEKRMSAFLTSPRGIKFLLGQQLLQSGNAISETRLLNPLFINLNLTPNFHFNRQLADQTDIVLGPERSPASTPEIGAAGRLQNETSTQALVNVVGTPAGRSIISLFLGQIGGSIASTIGIGGEGGTLGINTRPEVLIGPDKRFYSVLLREGYPLATGQRELSIVANALEAAGAIGATFGLPNIFTGLTDGFVNPIPAQSIQMRYGPGDQKEAIRYLPTSVKPQHPILLSPSIVRISKAVRGINLLQIGFGALVLGSSTTIRRVGTALSAASNNINQIFSAGVHQVSSIPIQTEDLVSDLSDRSTRVVEDELTFPDDSLKKRYVKDDRLSFVRAALAEQADLIDEHINVDKVPEGNRGILGGVSLEKLRTLNLLRKEFAVDQLGTTEQAQQFFGGLERREISPGGDLTAPGYYHDTLNLVGRIEGTEGVLPAKTADGTDIPTDYINVTIFDKINDRLEPFRAIIEGLSETVSPEFNSTRYIGRIERNIVYLGATRTLNFTLYVHAWSPRELQRIWDKVNFITGLAFPSKVSSDGFLLPPIVELTIGDMYVNQPGYFTGITHNIVDGTSWEIEEGAQVPHTVQMALSFDLIEKESMVASSAFYGFGLPVTE